jgi:hypothetical protein
MTDTSTAAVFAPSAPTRPHSIAGGCDQGADEHRQREAEENFTDYE